MCILGMFIIQTSMINGMPNNFNYCWMLESTARILCTTICTDMNACIKHCDTYLFVCLYLLSKNRIESVISYIYMFCFFCSHSLHFCTLQFQSVKIFAVWRSRRLGGGRVCWDQYNYIQISCAYDSPRGEGFALSLSL